MTALRLSRLCALALLLAVWAGAPAALADTTLSSGVVGAGGGVSTGGGVTLSGTIGQPIVGSSSGGGQVLLSGFWAAVLPNQGGTCGVPPCGGGGNPSQTPELGSLVLFGAGALSLLGYGRQRRRVRKR